MKWNNVASMNCNRSALGATIMNDKIYVCGGYDGTIALKSCEEYCPKLNRYVIMRLYISNFILFLDGKLYHQCWNVDLLPVSFIYLKSFMP